MHTKMCKNAAQQQTSPMNRSRPRRLKCLRLAGPILGMCLSMPTGAEITLGHPLPPILLEGDSGGHLDGTSWNSNSLSKKLHILMYVDPDEVKVNAHVEDALAEQGFDRGKVGSVAVINMAATWKPNLEIEMILKKKQEKYPHTLYLRDLRGEMVSKWGLVDNSYHVLLVGHQGEALFSAGDALSKEQVRELISIINQRLSTP